ncbi:MAG: hypothetical protein HY066_17460 [Betaproteobacteria bacterium]|nr:hypothetical protein [Betaproteobacteria bacterium]
MEPIRVVVPRYRVNWKIALIFDEAEHRPTYLGTTYDLTMIGTAMLMHHDVFTEHPVTVVLAIPPLHRDHRARVIEITARQAYSVYSGETSCFRLGLEFDSFKAGGLSILRNRLSSHRPLLAPQSYDRHFPRVG